MRHVLLFAILLVITDTCFSQDAEPQKAFASAHIGIFSTDNETFEGTYGSSSNFVFGAGLGFPLVRNLFIYGKGTYFSKTNGGADFSQWLVNFGLQYTLAVSLDLNLAFQGGGAYTIISEEISFSNGSSISLSGKGIVGFFAGIGLEKQFNETPFAVFAEAQQNFSRNDVASMIGTYGGFNATIGFRYYFQDRRSK